MLKYLYRDFFFKSEIKSSFIIYFAHFPNICDPNVVRSSWSAFYNLCYAYLFWFANILVFVRKGYIKNIYITFSFQFYKWNCKWLYFKFRNFQAAWLQKSLSVSLGPTISARAGAFPAAHFFTVTIHFEKHFYLFILIYLTLSILWGT